MRVMQIGDLHFDNRLNKTEKDKRANCFDQMFEFLEVQVALNPIDYLVVGGDIAYHSAEDEYEEARLFFERLLKVLELEKSNVIMCPGNHDLLRDEMEYIDIPGNPSEIEERYLFEKIERLSGPFKNYIKFCNDLSIAPAVCRADGLKSHLLGVRSFENIQFLILNSAWAAKNDNYDGKMFIGSNFIESIIAEKLLDENKVTLTVMHHPDSCLIDFERGSYRGSTNTLKKIQQFSNLTLCGHTHEIELSISVKHNTPLCTCGAAFIDNHYPNGVAFYDIEDKQIIPTGCYYNDGTWIEKKAESINLRVSKESGKRELTILHKMILKEANISYRELQCNLNKTILDYINNLRYRRKGWLSDYDKALLLLLCSNEIAKEVIDIHFPESNSKKLKFYVDSVTNLSEYRNICLAISLSQMLGSEWKNIYKKIIKLEPIVYNHSIWGECTNEQYRKVISNQKNTEIFQIKLMGAKYRLMDNVFNSIHNVVSGIELCLASPYIISDSTLGNLEMNYYAPEFFRGEYLKDDENSYKIDAIRRSLIILNNLERFMIIHETHNIPIIVHFFKDEYPGFGYQSIKEAGFAHIFPDCLPLSKPKFRFAFEINSRDLINELERNIKNRILNKEVRVETIELNKNSIISIKNKIQKEIGEYFLNEKISFDLIEKNLIQLADKVEKDINLVKRFLEECYEV